VPLPFLVIPSFIVFRGSTMGARGKIVLLGRFPVCLVHRRVLPCSHLHETDQSFADRQTFGSETFGKLRAARTA